MTKDKIIDEEIRQAVKELSNLLEEFDLTEVQIENNKIGKIKVAKNSFIPQSSNIASNQNVSIYFSLKELNKTKSNNPRLTINGIIKKHVLKKENKEFVDLLNTYQKIESGSKMWGMFTDFNFYSLIPKRALYIEGFGKAYQKVY